jgi:L,D-transpeptidase YbiS
MRLHLNIKEQQLTLIEPDQTIRFSVSTAANGVGEQSGSGCTPRGSHIIRAKIGDGLPVNAVFVGRRFTGEIYSPELALAHPSRDWILTRIIWLSGCERGLNRLGNVDSMRRYIYIHGTPETEPMGVPASHGCIRMRNKDLLTVFQRVPVGTSLLIEEC